MSAGRSFRKRAKQALSDTGLQNRLREATTRTLEKRARLVREIPDWEDSRKAAARIRRESLRRHDSLYRQAKESLEARSCFVYRVSDAEEARKLVLGILGPEDRIVKGKSMLSEEIGLLDYLQSKGKTCHETDLGEWILQLLGQKPSHLTAPALHLDRKQIGDLFRRTFREPEGNDPEELTAVARRRLRPHFLGARVGITGANFVCADSGHLVLLENEGNIGLSSTLPPLHIALTGIEKILPGIEDLDPLLRLLPASATGQRATAYVSLLGGPALDDLGPRERHVIFVDNGRSTLLGRSDSEVLACIRCASCLNICPVYRQVGGHSYGSVYPGPVGILLAPFLDKGRERHETGNSLSDACSLCGACAEVCPVEIPLPELIRQARGEKADGAFLARLLSTLIPHPRLFRFWLRLLLPLIKTARGRKLSIPSRNMRKELGKKRFS
ncbi:MAG: lactate utilization protein B [Candidatus Krumholzibacteria bacterium]|jgi:L-lactate dehydrogenase complex protein LldF|nr:lactate utilization protein B [Candidatus Krumholzibacteria bacterium]MDP6668475.1 lactate utilization protein B [Candidatus Krumholzibacteria bacterium]MDP6797369.1 lactate utilization protein B [Candidatus Krumholzibacteria bacterium]MDP7021568.1 lactate utilization protein B [Candidatus Krumholzibacteria bacterium]